MTTATAIARADSRKPNAFTTAEKQEWVAALEGRIAAELMLLAPEEVEAILAAEADDAAAELLVNRPYDDVYVLWLCARIDEANGEWSQYANSLQVFNDHYGSFANAFLSRYDPAQGYLKEEYAREWMQ